MQKIITESEVEQVALDILSELKYKVIYGPDIAPDGLRPERQSYADVILIDRLREAIDRFNLKIPAEAKDEAVKRILRAESPDLVINNHYFHKILADGVDVEYRENQRLLRLRLAMTLNTIRSGYLILIKLLKMSFWQSISLRS